MYFVVLYLIAIKSLDRRKNSERKINGGHFYSKRFISKRNFDYKNIHTGKESMRKPTAGLARIYKIGKNDVINPMISGEIPSSLPITLTWGRIGPIADDIECHLTEIFSLDKENK